MNYKHILSMALAVPCVSYACPFDIKDPLHRLRATADTTVVKVSVTGPGCDNTGSGFFFSPQGHILTASHVIPSHCENPYTAINVWWTEPGDIKLLGPLSAKVLARSKLDVVALSLASKPDPSRKFLAARLEDQNTASLRMSCVLIPSREDRQPATYSTFAEIVSVSTDGDRRWSLSGEGFNAERSGSPVILASGQAAAIFVSRPRDPSNRDNIIFSRASVIPLTLVSKNEIDIAALAAQPGDLSPFVPPATSKVAPVKTSFGISITQNGNRIEPGLPNFFISETGNLSQAPTDLFSAGIQAFVKKNSLVRRINVTKSFHADQGFVFDPSSVSYSIDSINPLTASLPTAKCVGPLKENCVDFQDGFKKIQLNFWMYPGVDARRSWLDAELHVTQVPE